MLCHDKLNDLPSDDLRFIPSTLEYGDASVVLPIPCQYGTIQIDGETHVRLSNLDRDNIDRVVQIMISGGRDVVKKVDRAQC